MDLRSAFRRGLSLTSYDDGCCRIEDTAFPALFRDFRVALMTSVARIAFSLGDNSSPENFPFFGAATFMVPDLGARGFRGLAAELPFEFDFKFATFANICVLVFVDSRSLRRVTVAAVHVDVEATAFLTESALTCREVMLVIICDNVL